MSLPALEGVVLLAGATLLGALLGRLSGRARLPYQWLRGTAGVVLAVLVLDQLHDHLSLLWTAGFAVGFAFAVLLGSVSYGSAAAAIGVHRFVEGATLALVLSPAAVLAFCVHGLAEGFAVAATAPQRTVRLWLAVACVSPVLGVLVAVPFSSFVNALAAGVIARTAVRCLRPGQPPESSSSAPSGTRSLSRSSSQP